MFGRKRLQRENDFLREHLGWYANSANWRRKGVNGKGQPRKWLKSPAAFDRGARAKFALTQVSALVPRMALWKATVPAPLARPAIPDEAYPGSPIVHPVPIATGTYIDTSDTE
jgi:hypothetical protein